METSASHVQPGPVAPVPLPVPGGRSVRTAPLKLPAIVLLLLWSIVPLAMTLWFSFQHYNLLNPGEERWAGVENYRFLVTARPDGDKRTAYAGHFYLPQKKQWQHLATFSTITNGELLKGYYSFVEDFRRNRV